MYVLHKYFKKLLYSSTAVLAGILLFTVLTGFNIEKTSLNPDFHANLFTKYDIYSGTQYVLESTFKGLANNLKPDSSVEDKEAKEIFSLIEKNLTSELISKNINSLRDGLFEYFRNDRKFLPDIYLSTDPNDGAVSTSTQDQAQNAASQALSKINKVNLGAVLIYMDRNDIVDYLSFLKFAYYTVNLIPSLLLPGFLMLFLIGLGLFRKFTDVIKWFAIAFASCGAAQLLLGGSLLICEYAILPNNIYPITMTLALGNEPVLAYLRDCINPTVFFTLFTGIIFILVASAAVIAPKLFPDIFMREGIYTHDGSQKTYIIIRNSLYGFCLVILLTASYYKILDVNKDFVSNDFGSVISKMKGVATVTQVIAAKDDTIYNVQLKVIDEKSGKPIKGIGISISGKSSEPEKDYNETGTTNEQGEVKFFLDKGSFRISFASSNFPVQYKIPSPFYVDLKASGTQVISINLEHVPDVSPKWGFAEIEILDPDNNPLPNAELAVLGIPFAPGYPDKVYSYSNSEGIAVFKLNEGSYKVNFEQGKLPEKYQLPENLDINIVPNSLTRYTIRLVEKKDSNASPSSR